MRHLGNKFSRPLAIVLSLPTFLGPSNLPPLALKGPWILAGGASHRIQAANSSRPGKGAGRDRSLRNSSRSDSGPAPLPGRKGNNNGLSGGWRHRLISAAPPAQREKM